MNRCLLALGVVTVLGLAACGSSGETPDFGDGGKNQKDAQASDDDDDDVDLDGGPDDVISFGDVVAQPDAAACGHVISAIMRDFKPYPEGGHIDFERDEFVSEDDNPTLGLVKDTLDKNHKPVYALT